MSQTVTLVIFIRCWVAANHTSLGERAVLALAVCSPRRSSLARHNSKGSHASHNILYQYLPREREGGVDEYNGRWQDRPHEAPRAACYVRGFVLLRWHDARVACPELSVVCHLLML